MIAVAGDDPAVVALYQELGEIAGAELSGLERLIRFEQAVGIQPGDAGGPAPSFEQLGAMGDAIAERTDGRHLVVASGNHFPRRAGQKLNNPLDAFLRTAA